MSALELYTVTAGELVLVAGVGWVFGQLSWVTVRALDRWSGGRPP